MFTQDRDQLRRAWLEAWRKHQAHEPLEPIEQLIARTIADHPEYHKQIEAGDKALGREYAPEQGETNPFMHMGMHLAIHEQLSTNRPDGITAAYQALLMRLGDSHKVEHAMMECLAEALWQAQCTGRPPDERAYLACVERLALG